MKNKEWLKNRIITEKYYTEGRELKAKDSYEEGLAKGTRKGLQISLDLIDQLEEPEQEKVVVPQFVADWMNKRKQNFKTSHDAILYIHSYGWDDETHIDFKLYKWIPDNVETFARAWLDGYTVEKEKMYRVVLIKGKYLIYNRKNKQLHNQELDAYVGDYEQREFTEQEIKSIDERFWAFAEEVTE